MLDFRFAERLAELDRVLDGDASPEEQTRQAEADSGKRTELLSTQEREEIRRLRKENYELRRANEILKSASLFFARELDPDRPK